MGMAASQARLLSITSRMADNELKAQIINNSKMRLASESSRVSDEYITALNSATMMISNHDEAGNCQYQPLTFNRLTSFSTFNNQYGLVDPNGKLLVSEREASMFQKANSVEGFLEAHGLKYDTTYFDVIKDADGNKVDSFNPYMETPNSADPEHPIKTFLNPPDGYDLAELKRLYQDEYNLSLQSAEYEEYTNLLADYKNKELELSYVVVSEIEDKYDGAINDIINQLNGQQDGLFQHLHDDKERLLNFVTNTSDTTNCIGKYLTSATGQNFKNRVTGALNGLEITEESFWILPSHDETYKISSQPSKTGWTYYDWTEPDPDDPSKPGTPHHDLTSKTFSFGDSACYCTAKCDDVDSNQYRIIAPSFGEEFTTEVTIQDASGTTTYTDPFDWPANTTMKITVTKKGQKDTDTSVYEYLVTNDDSGEPGTVELTTYASFDTTKAYLSEIAHYIKQNYAYAMADDYAENSTGQSHDIWEEKNELQKQILFLLYGGTKDDQGKVTSLNSYPVEAEAHLDELDWLIARTNSNSSIHFTDAGQIIENIYVLDLLFDTYGEPTFGWVDENGGDANAKATWYTNLYNRMQDGYKVLEDGLASSNSWIQYALESGLVTMEQVDKSNDWVSTIHTNISDITEVTDDVAVAKAEAEYKKAMNNIENKDKRYDIELKNIDTEHNSLQKEYESVKKVIDSNIQRTFKIFS